jgi:hypothetical protein
LSTDVDFPEAHMSPLDAGADEMRAVKVRKLPKELFMLLRVVTLGAPHAGHLQVRRVRLQGLGAARARGAQKAGIEPPPPPPPACGGKDGAKGVTAGLRRRQHACRTRCTSLAEWMLKPGLPCTTAKALTPVPPCDLA